MVSRSLEKMMLIAIGLATAVVVGVPVLLYAIDTIESTSRLETAESFANYLHNLTLFVDDGRLNQTTVEVFVPVGVVVSAQASTLTISFAQGESALASWSEIYSHNIALTGPSESGIHHMTIGIVGDALELVFIAVS